MDLDLVIPHGTGIPADDQAESRALSMALGDCATRIPVWPTKSMLSNTGAASGHSFFGRRIHPHYRGQQ